MISDQTLIGWLDERIAARVQVAQMQCDLQVTLSQGLGDMTIYEAASVKKS